MIKKKQLIDKSVERTEKTEKKQDQLEPIIETK